MIGCIWKAVKDPLLLVEEVLLQAVTCLAIAWIHRFFSEIETGLRQQHRKCGEIPFCPAASTKANPDLGDHSWGSKARKASLHVNIFRRKPFWTGMKEMKYPSLSLQIAAQAYQIRNSYACISVFGRVCMAKLVKNRDRNRNLTWSRKLAHSERTQDETQMQFEHEVPYMFPKSALQWRSSSRRTILSLPF